jgi:hypothetical protein
METVFELFAVHKDGDMWDITLLYFSRGAFTTALFFILVDEGQIQLGHALFIFKFGRLN